MCNIVINTLLTIVLCSVSLPNLLSLAHTSLVRLFQCIIHTPVKLLLRRLNLLVLAYLMRFRGSDSCFWKRSKWELISRLNFALKLRHLSLFHFALVLTTKKLSLNIDELLLEIWNDLFKFKYFTSVIVAFAVDTFHLTNQTGYFSLQLTDFRFLCRIVQMLLKFEI